MRIAVAITAASALALSVSVFAQDAAKKAPGEHTMTGCLAKGAAADTFVEAVIPIDAGVLRLRLVALQGRWLVDGIDWERA